MTDDEFQRLKEAEKDHLRKKKRLQATLEALKRRDRVQRVVTQMEDEAEQLLDETRALVQAMRRDSVQAEGRLEALGDDDELSFQEAETALREEKAEALVEQMKANTSSSSSRRDTDPEEADEPEKTIGRMRDPRDV